jgi:hypothetical protein
MHIIALVLLIVVHILFAPYKLIIVNCIDWPKTNPVVNFTKFGTSLHAKDLILVNPPAAFSIFFLYPIQWYLNKSVPSHIRILSPGHAPVEIFRKDIKTLVVRPKLGYMPPPWPTRNEYFNKEVNYFDGHFSLRNFSRKFDLFFNTAENPMPLGHKIELSDVIIEVTDLTSDGRPAEATFNFKKSLEDTNKKWVKWRYENMEYEDFLLPLVGQTIHLE